MHLYLKVLMTMLFLTHLILILIILATIVCNFIVIISRYQECYNQPCTTVIPCMGDCIDTHRRCTYSNELVDTIIYSVVIFMVLTWYFLNIYPNSSCINNIFRLYSTKHTICGFFVIHIKLCNLLYSKITT